MEINNPTEAASFVHHTSTQGTKVVVEAIKGCGQFSSDCHMDARHETRKALEEVAKQKLHTILANLSPGRQCAIRRIVKGKTSCWLTTLPLQSFHFDLAPIQFRDALLCKMCKTYLICQPNVMVVGLISLSNMSLTVKKGDWLYCATIRFVTALEIWPVRCGPKSSRNPL